MKKLLVFLLSLALALPLIACSQDPSDSSSSASKSEALSSSALSDEPVTIQWIQHQIEVAEQTEEFIAAYSTDHPNVTIELSISADAPDVLMARASTNNMPDIYMTEAYGGVSDYADYSADLSEMSFADQIVDAAKGAVTVDGKILALPMQLSGFGIIYNKGIFEKYKIEVPTTPEELEAVSQKLLENGVTPFINQYKDDWLIGEITGVGVGRGDDATDFFADIKAGTADIAGRKQISDIFDFISTSVKYGQDNPLSDEWNSACTKMGMEEGAMMPEGIWVYDTIKEINPDIDLGIFGIPLPGDDAPLAVDVNGALHISSTTEHADVCEDILNYFVTSEAGQQYIYDCAYISAWKSCDSELNSCGEDVQKYVDANNTSLWGWIAISSAYETDAGAIAQKFVMGDCTKDEAVNDIADLLTRLAQQ